MHTVLPYLALASLGLSAARPMPRPPGSCTRTSGLTLPDGFCAVLVAERLGRVRQITVLPNGDVLAALASGNGGVVTLRDTDGDGRADVRQYFFGDGGTGILYRDGFLWFAPNSRVVRWAWRLGDLRPADDPEVVIEDLPTGGHAAKSFVLLGDDLVVNIGSETNSCQVANRSYRSPGHDPCDELDRRAGLWRFRTDRLHQHQRDGVRFATGLRNTLALAVEPGSGRLYAAPHGRDQLGQNWGYSDEENAELPAEELLQVESGDDFGWPYCYFDQIQGRRVLAPEYGGTGTTSGRCDAKKNPLIGFPGHWAPMAMVFYEGTQFSAKYRGGLFLAFHGSWNRAPRPQQGFRVVFVPFEAPGKPAGTYETFATSAKGETALRPAGLAVGPDGSLYIGDEASGTIWRVMAQS